MDEERDDVQTGGIRGGEGLADGASSPEAAERAGEIPSDLGRESLRGDGLAEDAARPGADNTPAAEELGREGIRGDGLAEDA